ncbi:MAG: 23S rRNA (adenine(2030)-N(6))-methyltransferase RlmJ [Spirochaetaceae bacterium]|nr:23S rRNA (adenine(2030)-N(6))-methyltransferase RlmJ [Spirochaetaceae bacterium]
MLSYRHAFHAGNHADLLKHLTLTLILKSLTKKDKPFTVFDTHAGAGIYELDDSRLNQTEEAKKGILKLLEKIGETQNIPEPLLDYLEICRLYAKNGLYPGSPEIERCIMRGCDKLFISELHNTEIQIIEENIKSKPLLEKSFGFPSVFLRHEDGFSLLKSQLPPLVKRGLIITDPSYEVTSDYTSVAENLKKALEKWNTATIAVWYPLLEHRQEELSLMKSQLTATAERFFEKKDNPYLCAELCVNSLPLDENEPRLYGSGMLIINPPYKLDEQLKEALPFLQKILAENKGSWEVSASI